MKTGSKTMRQMHRKNQHSWNETQRTQLLQIIVHEIITSSKTLLGLSIQISLVARSQLQ